MAAKRGHFVSQRLSTRALRSPSAMGRDIDDASSEFQRAGTSPLMIRAKKTPQRKKPQPAANCETASTSEQEQLR